MDMYLVKYTINCFGAIVKTKLKIYVTVIHEMRQMNEPNL